MIKILQISICSLAVFTSANAAVVITFQQVGADVRISADGTLALDSSITSSTTPLADNRGNINPDRIVAINHGAYYVAENAGFNTATTLPKTFVDDGTVDVSSGAFGYFGNSIYWVASDITGGNIGAVSQLTWSNDENYFYLRNTQLSDINADDLDNQVVWTANTTNDTISINTAPDQVPEPKSLSLLGLGAALLILQRNRRLK